MLTKIIKNENNMRLQSVSPFPIFGGDSCASMFQIIIDINYKRCFKIFELIQKLQKIKTFQES